jgi:hypothetical protein
MWRGSEGVQGWRWGSQTFAKPAEVARQKPVFDVFLRYVGGGRNPEFGADGGPARYRCRSLARRRTRRHTQASVPVTERRSALSPCEQVVRLGRALIKPGPMSASLIGHSGSSTFRLSTAAVLMSLAGSRFSSDSAQRPFQHGVRRQGGTIFAAALP